MTLEEFICGRFEGLPIRKTPRFECPEFLEWNRQQNCIICGKNAPSDPSHCKKKKRCGNNASDIWVIPKCRGHHTIYESISYESFNNGLKQKGLSIPILIFKNWDNFCDEKGIKRFSDIALEIFEDDANWNNEYREYFISLVEQKIKEVYAD